MGIKKIKYRDKFKLILINFEKTTLLFYKSGRFSAITARRYARKHKLGNVSARYYPFPKSVKKDAKEVLLRYEKMVKNRRKRRSQANVI